MKYRYWNCETMEKSRLVSCDALSEAISRVETEFALSNDPDYEGWRIEDATTGDEMTLAEAKERSAE